MVKQNNRNDLNCNETRRKVCIIGLDGATFDVIEPLIKNGDLPNIASIMKGGVSAELNSTFFPQSAAAWTSFATGKNPGSIVSLVFLK